MPIPAFAPVDSPLDESELESSEASSVAEAVADVAEDVDIVSVTDVVVLPIDEVCVLALALDVAVVRKELAGRVVKMLPTAALKV